MESYGGGERIAYRLFCTFRVTGGTKLVVHFSLLPSQGFQPCERGCLSGEAARHMPMEGHNMTWRCLDSNHFKTIRYFETKLQLAQFKEYYNGTADYHFEIELEKRVSSYRLQV